MKQFHISRKHFLKNSALGLAGLTFVPGVLHAESKNKKAGEDYSGALQSAKKYTLKNVCLETGFQYEGDEVIATKTELFSIEIEHAKIKKISPNQPNGNAIDAKGMLMLPSFKDTHIHLDKTFYGGAGRQ